MESNTLQKKKATRNAAATHKKRSNMSLILHRLAQDKVAMVALGVLVFLVIISIAAPLIAPYDPYEIDVTAAKQAPSAAHIFGTDSMGRDIFSRILYGGRYSLALGFCGSLFTAVIGTVLGTIIGYYGGAIDNFFMRICDVWQAIPGQLLAIVISTVLGGGFINTVLAMSIGGIPMSIRSTRAMCLKEREMDYLEAAVSYDCSKTKIMFKHMLPNIISPTIVGTTMSVGGTIMGAAGLSFIGLGIQAPTPEWGAMLSDARSMALLYPYMMIFPGLMIAITVLAINLFGDGLRDAMDPKLKN
ncbi:MAG: ABC transporter permease [Clostridiales bacterium]|nr:ABC transporter permease [Clostridiales bacterium]